MAIQHRAAGSSLPSNPANTTNPFVKAGWPLFQEPTFDPQRISDGGPLNAVLIDGDDFRPYPTEWMWLPESNETMLPASCYNCNPKGCMCSTASKESWNNTDVGQLLNVCEVCRDSPFGMICYCSEQQWNPDHVCGDPRVDRSKFDPKTGDICRLNKEKAGVTLVNATTGNMLEATNGAGSSKGSQAKAMGLVAAAALGTATAMIL